MSLHAINLKDFFYRFKLPKIGNHNNIISMRQLENQQGNCFTNHKSSSKEKS
jgi:hypothetical protein